MGESHLGISEASKEADVSASESPVTGEDKETTDILLTHGGEKRR